MFIPYSQYLGILIPLLLLGHGALTWRGRTLGGRIVTVIWYILLSLFGWLMALYMGWVSHAFSMQNPVFSPQAQKIVAWLLIGMACITAFQGARLLLQQKRVDGVLWASLGFILATWALSANYFAGEQDRALPWLQMLFFVCSIATTLGFLVFCIRRRSAR